MKRKKPKLVALGIKPVRTAEKNIRHLWRADVEACSSSSGGGGGAEQVHIHLAGNGFLYRCVASLIERAGMLVECSASAELATRCQTLVEPSVIVVRQLHIRNAYRHFAP